MATRGMVLWGRYRLLDVLGDGGMARVYRAEDQRLNRIVAVKILHQQYLGQPEFVRRFEQEAQLAAGLSHPNIVAIYDVGRDDDTYFIVMEYVQGSSLKAVIAREAPLPLDRAIAVMRQIGQALDVAHAHGVIHRDIKPENILLTPANLVKVSDFGIARALTSQGHTATGMVLGSVSYFSPEQAQGKPATAESDLYSSGIVLYEMLTAHLPFAAENPLATAMQHITQPPASPRAFAPRLPASVDAVVLKAISKNPADRFHSGAALADALTVAAVSGAGQVAAVASGGRAAASRFNPAPSSARTVQVRRAAAPASWGAVAGRLLVLALCAAAVVFAAFHLHDIGGILAGGSPPSTSTATAPATATPVRAPATTPIPIVAKASATSVPPSATSTAARATATPSATAAPSASLTASPSSTSAPTAAAPGHGSAPAAAIVTARNVAQDATGTYNAVGPTDAFTTSAAPMFAVFHIRNFPQGGKVVARWTFPDGKHADVPLPSFSNVYAEEYERGAGHYKVSAVVNGKVAGSHAFIVTSQTAGSGTTGAGTPGAGTPGGEAIASGSSGSGTPGAESRRAVLDTAALAMPNRCRHARHWRRWLRALYRGCV